MIAPKKYKTVLLKRLAELDERLHDIEAELDAHQSKDWEELAVEREDDEVLEGLGRSGEVEITRIRAALRRIRDGEYGICTKCGDEISQARLDVLPDTPFCKTCAAAL
jgi:RNA polymerase-binding transcription factor DksA